MTLDRAYFVSLQRGLTSWSTVSGVHNLCSRKVLSFSSILELPELVQVRCFRVPFSFNWKCFHARLRIFHGNFPKTFFPFSAENSGKNLKLQKSCDYCLKLFLPFLLQILYHYKISSRLKPNQPAIQSVCYRFYNNNKFFTDTDKR